MTNQTKRTLYIGGLADEVDQRILHAMFIPFGDIVDIQIPMNFETQQHRGFGFVQFELAEDAAAAMDNLDESELFGRTVRVSIARPMRVSVKLLKIHWISLSGLTAFSQMKDPRDLCGPMKSG